MRITYNLARSIPMTVISIALVAGTPWAPADPFMLGTLTVGSLAVAIWYLVRDIKEARLPWEERTCPPMEPGDYLARRDARGEVMEITISPDGRVRKQTNYGPVDWGSLANKPREWAKVGA